MAESWDNIPGTDQEYGQLDLNAADGQTDENDRINLAQNFNRRYIPCTNYTDWDPTNNNGQTDDDKLIEEYFKNNITIIESDDDTSANRDDSDQTTSDVEHEADTTTSDVEHQADTTVLHIFYYLLFHLFLIVLIVYFIQIHNVWH